MMICLDSGTENDENLRGRIGEEFGGEGGRSPDRRETMAPVSAQLR